MEKEVPRKSLSTTKGKSNVSPKKKTKSKVTTTKRTSNSAIKSGTKRSPTYVITLKKYNKPKSPEKSELVDLFNTTYDKRLLSTADQYRLLITLNLPTDNKTVKYLKITFDVSDIVRTNIEELKKPYYDYTPGSWHIEGRDLYIVIDKDLPIFGNKRLLARGEDEPHTVDQGIKAGYLPIDAILKYITNISIPFENKSWSTLSSAIKYLAKYKALEMRNNSTLDIDELEEALSAINLAESPERFKSATKSSISSPPTTIPSLSTLKGEKTKTTIGSRSKKGSVTTKKEEVSTLQVVYIGFQECTVTTTTVTGKSTVQTLSLQEAINIIDEAIRDGFEEARERPIVKWNQKATPLVFPLAPLEAYGKEEVELGRGTYGTVYLTRKGKEVFAIKKIKIRDLMIREAPKPIKASGFSSPLKLIKIPGNIPEDSLKEITSLLKCNHPHVVDLLDISIKETSISLVMPAAEGNLKDLIPALSPIEANKYILQILSGLAYLHSIDIIHRDLKPQNILVYSCEDDPAEKRLVIADFGLARTLICNTTKGDALSNLVFTLWYRPPEILLGLDYDFKGDLWSVGCIYAEMITHVALFPGNSEEEMLQKIFTLLGTPDNKRWANVEAAPYWYPIYRGIRSHLEEWLEFYDVKGDEALLLTELLTLNPEFRINAYDTLGYSTIEGFEEPMSCGLPYPDPTELDCYQRIVQEQFFPEYKDFAAIRQYRYVIFEWALEVVVQEHLSWDALFLAYHLYDLYTFDLGLEKSRLQAYILGCLTLASKLKGPQALTAEDGRNLCANAYTEEQLIIVERNIFSKLNYNISQYTVYDLVKLGSPFKTRDLGAFILAIVLREGVQSYLTNAKIADDVLRILNYYTSARGSSREDVKQYTDSRLLKALKDGLDRFKLASFSIMHKNIVTALKAWIRSII